VRILIVTSQFPLAGEPTRGRPLYQTARELARVAEVRVVSPVAVYPSWARPRSYLFHPAEGATLGVDTEYVTYPALPIVTRPFNGWLCGRAIDAAVQNFKPDVVLSYWLYPDAYGAMCATRRRKLAFVAGARGSDIRVRDAISKRLTQRVVRAADRLLVVSEDLGRLAASEYGADPARVRVIANGCDASIFHLQERAAARAALGIAADARLVLYVGRLVAEKGLRELFDAAGEVFRSTPRLQLALIGGGPLHDELAARAADGSGPPVRLEGAQSPETVARWMAAADLVTLPSYSEGHPNVLVEALACGRPAVATPVGGIPEVIDADSGILVAVRDASALARGISEALERSWDERALSQRFSRDWQTVATDTLRACEEAVADRR
jgi:glycosyltransferase involved in cell wall biosynthesis